MARKCKAGAKPQKVDAEDARIRGLIHERAAFEATVEQLRRDVKAKDERILELEGHVDAQYAINKEFLANLERLSKGQILRPSLPAQPRYIDPNYPVPPPATYQPFPQWHTTAYRTTHGQG